MVVRGCATPAPIHGRRYRYQTHYTRRPAAALVPAQPPCATRCAWQRIKQFAAAAGAGGGRARPRSTPAPEAWVANGHPSLPSLDDNKMPARAQQPAACLHPAYSAAPCTNTMHPQRLWHAPPPRRAPQHTPLGSASGATTATHSERPTIAREFLCHDTQPRLAR